MIDKVNNRGRRYKPKRLVALSGEYAERLKKARKNMPMERKYIAD